MFKGNPCLRRLRAITAFLLFFLMYAPCEGYALTEGDYSYTVQDGQAAINWFTDSDYVGKLSVPNMLGGFPVASISHDAFGHCEGITDVTMPNTITNIGPYAFSGCFALTNIAIGASVISIGNNAFQYCVNLARITIPASVKTMGGSTFASCPKLQAIFFRGDAPSYGGGFYNTDDNAPVYYLPGSSNWETSFLIFHPTVCWNPTCQVSSSFRVFGEVFDMVFSGNPNLPVKVEASTNLSDEAWITVTNAVLDASGSLMVSDPDSVNLPSRFYRVVFP